MMFNVAGIAGSLRRASYNRALLRAAAELVPATLHVEIHPLDDIPLYNGDVEEAGVVARGPAPGGGGRSPLAPATARGLGRFTGPPPAGRPTTGTAPRG